jgi:hypothetical protein
LRERVIQADVAADGYVELGREEVFAQSARELRRNVEIPRGMAALRQDGCRQRDPEGRHDVAERPTVIAAEDEDDVGVEALCPIGRLRQRRPEPPAEGVLDVALLTGAMACADD